MFPKDRDATSNQENEPYVQIVQPLGGLPGVAKSNGPESDRLAGDPHRPKDALKQITQATESQPCDQTEHQIWHLPGA